MTHSQARPNLHEISSAGGFWHEKNTVKVLELKTFQFRNSKQKCIYPDFLLISLFGKKCLYRRF